MISSKRAYATGSGSCTQNPCPCDRPFLFCTSTRDSNRGLAQSLWGSLDPGVHEVLFESSKHLWWVWGLILNMILTLLPSLWGFSFVLRHGISLFGGIQYSNGRRWPNVDGASSWSGTLLAFHVNQVIHPLFST